MSETIRKERKYRDTPCRSQILTMQELSGKSKIQAGIDIAFLSAWQYGKEHVMEWDEVFVLLAIGSTAPYAIEATAAWMKTTWRTSHHNNGANARG